MTQVVGDQRPNMVCTATMPKAKPSQIKVSGMIGTGADITANIWPSSWPTTPQRDHTEMLEQQSCVDEKS